MDTGMNIDDVKFDNPLVIASGPLTASTRLLKEAERQGASGASTKLTFHERPFEGEFRLVYIDGFGPMHTSERRLSIEEGVRLIEEASEETSLTLFANITDESPEVERWTSLALDLEGAGADLIEANFCCPMVGLDEAHEKGKYEKLSGGATAGENPELVYKISKALSSELTVPLVCKLTPTVPNMANTAKACDEGGADAIALFGGPSHGLPPVEIENHGKPTYPLVKGASYGFVAGPSVKYPSYKRVAEVARAVNVPIIGSGGISTWRDAIEMMMWGADFVSITSSVLREGWGVVNNIAEGIESYLEEHSYSSFREIVGLSLKHLRPSSEVEIVPGYAEISPSKCIGCGECLKPGHCNAVSWKTPKEEIAEVDRKKCIGCGLCWSICPVDAIEMIEDG
ncbi:4Fe-4S binding protein [Candidatus Bipolaricaulota bacterium]|nr:4Fe-4S binding protein [Candidatus Bipolaricaulota bacterium]